MSFVLDGPNCACYFMNKENIRMIFDVSADHCHLFDFVVESAIALCLCQVSLMVLGNYCLLWKYIYFLKLIMKFYKWSYRLLRMLYFIILSIELFRSFKVFHFANLNVPMTVGAFVRNVLNVLWADNVSFNYWWIFTFDFMPLISTKHFLLSFPEILLKRTVKDYIFTMERIHYIPVLHVTSVLSIRPFKDTMFCLLSLVWNYILLN